MCCVYMVVMFIIGMIVGDVGIGIPFVGPCGPHDCFSVGIMHRVVPCMIALSVCVSKVGIL